MHLHPGLHTLYIAQFPQNGGIVGCDGNAMYLRGSEFL